VQKEGERKERGKGGEHRMRKKKEIGGRLPARRTILKRGNSWL